MSPLENPQEEHHPHGHPTWVLKKHWMAKSTPKLTTSIIPKQSQKDKPLKYR
jgi:hypothetical protein